MEHKKSWGYRMSFFLGPVVLGTEVSRFFHRQFLVRLFEKESCLVDGLDSNIGKFDFYHIFTSYLPLAIFCLLIIGLINFPGLNKNRKIIIIWGGSVLSSIIMLIFSEKYFEFSKSYYFTQQVGILICYYFATTFVVRDMGINSGSVYLFSALFFNSLFAHALQPVITKLEYDLIYFPYGEIEFAVICIYIFATGLFYFIQRKKKV